MTTKSTTDWKPKNPCLGCYAIDPTEGYCRYSEMCEKPKDYQSAIAAQKQVLEYLINTERGDLGLHHRLVDMLKELEELK